MLLLNRTGEHFRLIYDVKGRFQLHRIPVEEATWKLLKVKKKALGARGIPYIVTHDGRTIKYDFMTGKILQICHFRTGGICMLTGGRNIGRVGIIEKLEKHPGAFDICHIRDAKDHKFATRKDNIFIIGAGSKPLISLGKTKGIKYSIIEDRDFRLKRQTNPVHNQNNRKELSGKGVIIPKDTIKLRKALKEKKRLLKLLREQEAKQRKSQPKKKKKKKRKKI